MYFLNVLQSVLIHANDSERQKIKKQTLLDFAHDYRLDVYKLSLDMVALNITKDYKLETIVKNFEKVVK